MISFSNTQRTQTSSNSRLTIKNVVPQNSCWTWHLKRIIVGLSVFIVYNIVWLPWQTIQVMHFDQIWTICNDNLEDYQITPRSYLLSHWGRAQIDDIFISTFFHDFFIFEFHPFVPRVKLVIRLSLVYIIVWFRAREEPLSQTTMI